MSAFEDPGHNPLTSQHIQDARTASSDGGVTLYLHKLHVTSIDEQQAQELASSPTRQACVVERLALNKNRLSTLPQQFGQLNRLRYLNLRHNNFFSIPDVLTTMPSLDTLDLSFNKIRSFPLHPGQLVDLRILSLSQNKLTRLPNYLTQFTHLEILQIDNNPIEWPPKATLDTVGDLGDVSGGKESIQKLQQWLDLNFPPQTERDDSGFVDNWDTSMSGWKVAVHRGGPDDHNRSHSIESNLSISPEEGYERRPTSPSVSDSSRLRSDSEPPRTVLESNRLEIDPTHLRTASYGGVLSRPPASSSSVSSKQSLPDLRRDIPRKPTVRPAAEDRSFDSVPPLPLRKDSTPSSLSSHHAGSLSMDEHMPSTPPYVNLERNSYFKRSSTMLLNTALPKSLQCLLNTARGVLFAVSQLYTTLEQYAQHAVEDRLTSIFQKVLDPVNVNMLHLIRSLDRFHDISQKSVPSPAVCRGLVECCRDTISVFRKALNLLTLQLGLDACDDPRFVRWLILELYAVTTELAYAWKTLTPHLEALKPLIYASVFSQPSTGSYNGSFATQDNSLAPAVRLRSVDTVLSNRIRTARRHAGSFSSKDVEIGKDLPSYDIIPPGRPTGVASQRPTLRTPKRQATAPAFPASSSNTTLPHYPNFHSTPKSDPDRAHLRNGSLASISDINTLLSPSAFPADSPPTARLHVDKEIYQAVSQAIDIAPIVWSQMGVALADAIETNQTIKDMLDQARSVTKGLVEAVQQTVESDLDSGRRTLREQAHLFLKLLVQLSGIIKAYGSSHHVPTELHSNIVKLTKSAEEFAILLHISSNSSLVSHAQSPAIPKSASSLSLVEDNQLASSLTRSRSAQPSFSAPKQTTYSPLDLPQSRSAFLARPQTMRRIRSSRDTRLDGETPS